MPLSWMRGANLDAAVDKAYEACGGKKTYRSDAERVNRGCRASDQAF